MSKKPQPISDDGMVDMAQYEKTDYIWTLYKYLGEKDDFMVGSMVMPVEKLNDRLASQFVFQS